MRRFRLDKVNFWGRLTRLLSMLLLLYLLRWLLRLSLGRYTHCLSWRLYLTRAIVKSEKLLMDRVDFYHILIDALFSLNHNLRVDLAQAPQTESFLI